MHNFLLRYRIKLSCDILTQNTIYGFFNGDYTEKECDYEIMDIYGNIYRPFSNSSLDSKNCFENSLIIIHDTPVAAQDALKGDFEYFCDSYFQSYHDNADEDAKEYLKLYGISGPQDIVKLEVYRYPDAYSQECVVQITDAEQISQFYGYYSQLTESSEAYFNVLSQGPEAPPAGDNSNSVASWAGTAGDKLSNSRTIVIYAANGLSFSTEYYPNIQFLSRYAVDDAFAQWLQELAFS